MPATIEHGQQRAQLAQALLDVMRLFSSAYFQGERFGSRADDLLLYAALFIGQAEGRPLNHSKLADLAGLPRPTVIRKLKSFQARGAVERVGDGFVLSLSVVNSPEAIQAAEAARRSIRKTASAIADQR